MKTEIEKKLHFELKNNLKKVLEFYKDTVSWNDATRIFEEAAEEMGLEVKETKIPKIVFQDTNFRGFSNRLIFGKDKQLYDKEETNNQNNKTYDNN